MSVGDLKAWRPYLNLDRSIKELYGNPSRYLRDQIGKESEFEKPYWDDDYRSMHFRMPMPDWGMERDWGVQWNKLHLSASSRKKVKRWSGAGNIDEEQGVDLKCNYCLLNCWFSNTCEEPTDCHANVFCTTDPSGNALDIPKTDLKNYSVIGAASSLAGGEPLPKPPKDQKISGAGFSFRAIKGAIREIHPNNWAVGVDIWVDENQPEHVIEVTLVDGVGNICTAVFEKTCGCTCPAETAFTFNDALTLDTIVRSSSIDIFYSGGCGPYSWSVVGTGFSVTASTLTASTTLTADGTACGTATITGTDSCGTAVVAKIRCTSSGKESAVTATCNMGGGGSTLWSGWFGDTKYFVNIIAPGYERCGGDVACGPIQCWGTFQGIMGYFTGYVWQCVTEPDGPTIPPGCQFVCAITDLDPGGAPQLIRACGYVTWIC